MMKVFVSPKSSFIAPKNYRPRLTLRETEDAIKTLNLYFQEEISRTLNLSRVSAPLFLPKKTGLNDNLNGTEVPVTFTAASSPQEELEIIHSLAKWKRLALKRYGFKPGEGIYTNMNAIRKDEGLSNFHSIYVDQWDWELIIPEGKRKLEYLKEIVRMIFSVFKKTETFLLSKYTQLGDAFLPDEIHFVTTQELEDEYPEFSPSDREKVVAKKYGAVFVMQIGDKLKSGKTHDGRSPDYDDWTLNGDILFWYPPLECSIELSSMGIRVDSDALKRQVESAGVSKRLELPFHKMIIEKNLPLTIGGGLGQSRICMYFLRKVHVGEVQVSVWDAETKENCERHNIKLL